MASFEDGQQESFNNTDSEDSYNYEQGQRYGGMLDNSAGSSVSRGHSETESLSGLSGSDTASFGRASHSSHHSIDSPRFSSANSSGRVGGSPNLLAETPESPEHRPMETSTPKATPKLESQLASMSMSSDESSMNETDNETDKLTAFYTLAAPSMSRDAANRMECLMNRYWPRGQYPAVTAHLIQLFEEDAHSEVVGGDTIMSAGEVIEMAEQLGEPAFTTELTSFLANERVP